MLKRGSRIISFLLLVLLLLSLSLRGNAKEADEEKATEVVFGIHPVFTGDTFTLECNCKHPHDKKEACHPNCCLLIDRECVVRLFIVGRCRDLPDKPFIWRVRLEKDCHLKEQEPPEAEKREAKTGYLFEVKDETNVEVKVRKR